MQDFGAKSGASGAKRRASGGLSAKNLARLGPAQAGPQAAILKIELKALIGFF